MEKLIKHLVGLGLTDEQLGEMVRFVCHYIQTGTLPDTENKLAKEIFVQHIKKRVDFMLKERKRRKDYYRRTKETRI